MLSRNAVATVYTNYTIIKIKIIASELGWMSCLRNGLWSLMQTLGIVASEYLWKFFVGYKEMKLLYK